MSLGHLCNLPGCSCQNLSFEQVTLGSGLVVGRLEFGPATKEPLQLDAEDRQWVGMAWTPEQIRKAVLKVFGNASVKEVDALVAELTR